MWHRGFLVVCVGSLDRQLVCLAKALHWTSINSFSHSIEIDEKTQEHLVGGRTVLMNPAEVAKDRYARNILAMECENARRLLTESARAFWRWYLAVQMFVLPIICSGYLS